MNENRDILPVRVCSFDVGEKNMACCELLEDATNDSYKILNWEIIDISDKSSSLEKVCYNIPKMILEKKYINFSNHIAIESQPRFNTRMRIISYALSTSLYCLSPDQNALNIKFISPTQKLKSLDVDLKASYSKRKKEAINECEKLLKTITNGSDYMSILSEKKKLDDFADCFLQAIVYIEEQKNQRNKKICKRRKKSSQVPRKKRKMSK